jgi:hypothetical protein
MIYTIQQGFSIQPIKGGFAIFHNGERCLDYMNQTGLGKKFKSPSDAVKALFNCDFEVYAE